MTEEVERAVEILAEMSQESAYTKRLTELMDEQKIVMAKRIPAYGDSWIEEGIDGLMYDLIRKLRRLWKMVMIDGVAPNRNDTVDISNYSLMLQSLAEVDPKAVKQMRVEAVRGLFGVRE